MRTVSLAVATLAGCSFTPGALPVHEDAPAATDAPIDVESIVSIDAPPDGPPPNFHLHIEADIDGRSNIIVKGTALKWHHYTYAAPGRENGTNFATKLDTVNWQPTWPDLPDTQNRDCNCDSSIYTLTVGVPRALSSTTLSNKVARKALNLIQAPALANDYTLELEFDDEGSAGSATYKVDVDVVVQL